MADVQMMNRYCYFCMNPLNETQHKCPVCKHDRNEKVDAHGHLPRCILNNQYLVGRKLGNGGFGITYIGRDLFLDRIVAIKEYFPNSLAYRGADGMTVAAYNDSEGQKEQFEHGKQRTISEARTVVLMGDLPHVVKMYNAFLANGTAYIVMEYITGETLASCISREGKPMKWQRAADLLLPLLTDLQQMHDKNFIHRDISPDNIMIRRSTNKAVLLDFGAARDFHSEYTVAAGTWRDGYTPIEQYSEELIGQDGRTDEYSFCATMYFALTGKKPINSQYRAFKDDIEMPRRLGSDIDPAREAVLMRGFAVQKEQRFPTVTMLAQGLLDPVSVQNAAPEGIKQETPFQKHSEEVFEKKSSKKILTAVVAAAAIGVAAIAGVALLNPPEAEPVSVVAPNIAVPQQIQENGDFGITGEVKAENGKLTSVVVEIFEGDTFVDARVVQPNAASYQLMESEVDAWLSSLVAGLDDGEYRCVVSATASNGENDTTSVSLMEKAFRITSSNEAIAEIPAVIEPSQTAAPAVTELPKIAAEPAPQQNAERVFKAVELNGHKLIHRGETIRFGHFEQDGDKQNGQEEIEWLVLDVQNGKALLLSRYALGTARYRTQKGQSIHWENSEVRTWMYSRFLEEFSQAEKQALAVSGHAGDPVFLLSRNEVEHYLMDETLRTVQRTAAVKDWTSSECPWVLMSEGTLEFVDAKGSFNAYNSDKGIEIFGIRPAVWIDIAAAGFDTVKPLSANARVGQTVTFGSYREQTDGSVAPMEWIVVSREGGQATLLNANLVDSYQYNASRAEVSWKDCDLRKWLNNEFLQQAFTSAQQNVLLLTEVEDDVQDRVYLLSPSELEALFPNAEDRIPRLTAYAASVIVRKPYWWLRATGEPSDITPTVKDDGNLRDSFVHVEGNGVRPVICVDLNLLNN